FVLTYVPIRRTAGQPRERTARADHRLEQTPRGYAVAELQAVADEALRAEILRHGPQNMFQELSDQDDTFATAHGIHQLLHGFLPHYRLQDILKILLAKKIQAVARDSPQHTVKKPRGKRAAGKISGRTEHGHRCHCAASNPAFQEALTVPIEEAPAAQCADLEERALHAPVAHLAHTPGGFAIQVGKMIRHLFS